MAQFDAASAGVNPRLFTLQGPFSQREYCDQAARIQAAAPCYDCALRIVGDVTTRSWPRSARLPPRHGNARFQGAQSEDQPPRMTTATVRKCLDREQPMVEPNRDCGFRSEVDRHSDQNPAGNTFVDSRLTIHYPLRREEVGLGTPPHRHHGFRRRRLLASDSD